MIDTHELLKNSYGFWQTTTETIRLLILRKSCTLQLSHINSHYFTPRLLPSVRGVSCHGLSYQPQKSDKKLFSGKFAATKYCPISTV